MHHNLKYFPLILLSCSLLTNSTLGQKGNKEIALGNKAYQNGNYKEAATQYTKALKLNPKDETARYNLANSMQRLKNTEAAEKNYQQVAKNGSASLQPKANYNKGVTEAKNKQLQDAIESFKQSLRRAPEDNDARENLQKAINDLKQQNKDKNKQNNKNQPPPPKNNKQDQNKSNESPKEKQDKQRMDQLLDQLRNQEKDLQKKLQSQKNNQTKQPEKDW